MEVDSMTPAKRMSPLVDSSALPGASASGASHKYAALDETLRREVGRMSIRAIAKAHRVSQETARRRALDLGIDTSAFNAGPPWTDAETDILIAHHATHTDAQISKLLGGTRSPYAVKGRASVLGLARVASRWSGAEIEYLRAHCQTQTNAQIAAALKRSPKSVEKQLRRLGLRRAAPVKKPEVDIQDVQRNVKVLPPLGPGYGPRIVHRIGLSA